MRPGYHLILDQKVKGQGHSITNCKKNIFQLKAIEWRDLCQKLMCSAQQDKNVLSVAQSRDLEATVHLKQRIIIWVNKYLLTIIYKYR